MKHTLHRTLTLLVLLLLMPLSLWAQMVEPVHIKSQLVKVSPTEADIIFNATIDNGWHVYSTDLGDDGPISATFNVVQTTGVTPVGKLTAKGKKGKGKAAEPAAAPAPAAEEKPAARPAARASEADLDIRVED